MPFAEPRRTPTHLQVAARLLSLVTGNGAHDRVLLSLESVGGSLDVALGLGGLDFGFTGGVSLQSGKRKKEDDASIRGNDV